MKTGKARKTGKIRAAAAVAAIFLLAGSTCQVYGAEPENPVQITEEGRAAGADEMPETPADVQKVTLFTEPEALFADVILAVRPLETLSVKRDGDVYILSDETVLPCTFPTMKDGESFALDYISNHTKEPDYDRT